MTSTAKHVEKRADQAQSEKSGLSIGDGIAVAGLLTFILVWGGFFLFGDVTFFEETDAGYTDTQAIISLLLIFGPPLWAGSKIKKLLD